MASHPQPHISVVVESRLSGPASGHLVVNTEPEATADSLIAAFCTNKGIRHVGSYVLRTAHDQILDSTRSLSDNDIMDGEIVYLTNQNVSDEVFGFSNWLIMAAIALLIAITGLVAVCLIYSTTGSISEDYGIVFDAGSTHTTMMVYKWGGAKLNNTGVPRQVHKCNMEGGGIGAYVGREDQLADALRECLDEGKSAIPGGKVGTTPVYLGATGGMRVLQMQNPDGVTDIMQTVGNTFAISGFMYQDGMASIITGEAEGADAWVTSNFLNNTLTSGNNNGHSVGTLDLGGASTQYAIQVEQNGTVDLTLYGIYHDVLTESSLCFGMFQSQIRHMAQLTVEWKNVNKTVIDPCLPLGYSFNISLKEIFSNPCAQFDIKLRPKLDNATIVTFVGASSPVNCSLQVASLFNSTECTEHYKYQQCFNSQNLSATPTPYLAISGFYDVMLYLNLTVEPSTLQKYRDVVKAVCNQSWPKLQMLPKTSTGVYDTVTENYCYQGQYVDNLLTIGYSFNNDTWSSLNFVNSINNTDLGWALGYMINATNNIPAELPTEPIKLPVFVLLVILFAIFILLSLAFAIHAWKKKHQASAYQRLSQYGAI